MRNTASKGTSSLLTLGRVILFYNIFRVLLKEKHLFLILLSMNESLTTSFKYCKYNEICPQNCNSHLKIPMSLLSKFQLVQKQPFYKHQLRTDPSTVRFHLTCIGEPYSLFHSR